MSEPAAAEATAPCSLALAGDGWPGSGTTSAVAVALDRRAWCRVERGGEGLRVESKDGLLKASAKDVEELIAGGRMPLVARVLRASGLESGARVQTRCRVPAGSGLGEDGAVAVAVAGAVLRALGRSATSEAVAEVLAAVGSEAAGPLGGEPGVGAALGGGTVEVSGDPGRPTAATLAVDPGRVEEALLLVDSGSTRETGAEAPMPASADLARDLRITLVEGRFADVTAVLSAQWQETKGRTPGLTTAEIDAVVGLVERAGGAAWACGRGPGGLLGVWAPPGDRGPGVREAVTRALGDAGVRLFPARVDLLGLDVA